MKKMYYVQGRKPREYMKLSGSEIIIECLKKEGVDFIFGYPGGAVLHIYDALFNTDKIKHILVRHEQGATHAADMHELVENQEWC